MMTTALRGTTVLLLAAGLGFAATYRTAAREPAPAATPMEPAPAPAVESAHVPPVAPAAETVRLPPEIDARFWGVVLDRDRAPVAGATVTAVPLPDPPPLFPVPTLEECRDHLQRTRLARERHTVEATTADDGTFDLGGLIAATYEVVAVSPSGERTLPERAEPGWYLELRTPRGEPRIVETVITGTRELQPAVIVELRGGTGSASVEVIDPPGSIPEASWEFRGSRLIIPADDSASLLAKLEPGVEVRATGGGRSTPWVEILPDTERISLAFLPEPSADPRALLEVAVSIPPGEARQVEWVGALEIVPGAPRIDEARFLRAARWSMGSGESGLLQLRPERWYRVGAALGPMRTGFFSSGGIQRGPAQFDVEGTVFVGAEGARLELAVSSILDAEGSLVIGVRAEGGEVPADPRFATLVIEADQRRYASHRVFRASDGRYVLTDLSPDARAILDGTGAGELEVEVTDREFGARTVRLGRSSAREVVVEFPATARLEVEFATPVPDELRRAIQFVRRQGSQQHWIGAPEWNDGRAIFARAPAGESALGISAGSLHLLDHPIVLRSGQTTVARLALETLHPVLFADAENILGFAVIALADGRKFEPFDLEGTFWLPAGVHRLKSQESGEFPFSVPSDGPIRWRKP